MLKENREYKSSIFTMLLEDKNRALDVYNAVNDTNYDNVEDLEIIMLENAVRSCHRCGDGGMYYGKSIRRIYEESESAGEEYVSVGVQF